MMPTAFQFLTCLLMLSCFGGIFQPVKVMADDPSQDSTSLPGFYAFCFDMHDAAKRDLAQQATLLKQLGFDGAGHVGLENIEQRIKTLQETELKLFLAGMRVDLKQNESVAIKELQQAAPLLRDRNVLVYVVLAGLPTSDPTGSEKAVSVLRQLAEVAAEANVRLGIYPHTSDWVARIDHAVKVANQVDRPNVGVIFNLCHWLRNEETENLERVLHAAHDKLFGVTINGADLAGKGDNNWNRLIQPLDRGNFDIPHLLNALDEIGYDGPIGLMCYGIGGDAADHLKRSVAAWKKITAQ